MATAGAGACAVTGRDLSLLLLRVRLYCGGEGTVLSSTQLTRQ